MKQLALAKDLSLPIDVVTQKAAFMGRTGSGKTYGATKLAELMLDAGAQIVTLDPVGVWYGLRLDRNGKDPSGLEIPVFGGLHGDIPLEPTAGALLADLVVDRASSAILDVSQWERDSDKARFASDFASRFFYRKKASPSAVHLFLEECQEFVPQNPARGEEQMLHAFHRLIKLGRNFGIGVSLISQRPQEVNKKALNQTELLLAFQMTGPQERKAISAWVSEKGADEDVADVLPKLAVGEPHIWSPQWLQISRTVKIATKRTYNASSTPTFGAKAVEAKPLGSIDLEKLKKAMASTIEKAKETDPKELRATISRLQRELAAKPAANGHKPVKPVVDDVAIGRAVNAALSRQRRELRPVLDRLQRLVTPLLSLPDAVGAIARIVNEENIATPGALLASKEHRLNPSSPVASQSGSAPEGRAGGHAGRDSRERPAAVPFVDGLTKPQQRILNEIAQLHALGVERPTVKQVAVFCGVSHTTGSFLQDIRDLAKAGYINRGKGDVQVDELGRQYVEPFKRDRDLAEMWLAKLDGAQSKILELILRRRKITTEEIAAELGVSPTTGSFLQNLRDLRGYGVIEWDRGVAQPGALLS